jgi:DNA-binding ferritin-like protein (Dps family)
MTLTTNAPSRSRTMTRIIRLIREEQEWKAMQVRAEDIALLKDVLALFESSAAEGQSVLAVTGADVAAFCHERLRGSTPPVDRWRTALNGDVARKLAG